MSSSVGPGDGSANRDAEFTETLKSVAGMANLTQSRQVIREIGSSVIQCAHDRTVSIIVARQVLDGLAGKLRSSGSDDTAEADAVVDIADYLLREINAQGQSSNLVDQTVGLCEVAATAFETKEEYTEAAQRLASIPLDESRRRVSPEDKVRVWIRIVRDYLEVDDSTAAEPYLNKAKGAIFDVNDAELNLHFKLSQARINDAKREFLAASASYHDISFSPKLAEEERLHTLTMAVRCAVLAPAGPSRARALGRLYKDERSVMLANDFSILEKMFLNRLLQPKEIKEFAETLQPHQLATTADGSTVLERAVIEHNLLGVSLVYNNIPIASLANLLGLSNDEAKTEAVAARMIEQGRLVGRIDQLKGMVWFEGGEASGQNGSGKTAAPVDKELRYWGANVQSLAEEVERVTAELQKQFPGFVEANLVV
ncbi:cop9 signalosome complex subunit 4 [Ophiostoma piceae UAMH 11346]|uniref:COP9 signalosome complex subunit 4 n=1 Tax=Ophiostoma piceae (strain UAMH 11346) TaxID=1262450 RepID=S3CPF1_OPHP1|nr:cop9 signalosome complex subunit 4 [Ophiostoma piceae UAMH 11346]